MRGWLVALLALCTVLAPTRALADETIVIEATRLVPEATKTGERVGFVNSAQRAVHVEFTGDVRQHELIQVPATGPIWAIFHRPGTHPYVVHVYSGREVRALSGLVDVIEDETHKWDSQTCGVILQGVCLEP